MTKPTPEQLEDEIKKQIEANAFRDNLKTVELIRDHLKKKNNESNQNKEHNDK